MNLKQFLNRKLLFYFSIMKWNIVAVIVLYSHFGLCQGIGSVLDKSTNPGEVLMEFDNRSPFVVGDYYILDEWQNGDIALKSGALITGQRVNYDLEFDLLEVKFENQIKVVPLLKMDYFTVNGPDNLNRLFKPCGNYVYDNNVPLAGICQIINSNYFGLIIKYTSDIKEATYLPELDMGKKEDEKIVKKKYYLTFGDSACTVPRKKQLFIDLYKPHMAKLELYIKENKLNHRNEEDLCKIISYLNADLD